MDDERLIFLQQFATWLETWKSLNLKSGCLTADTLKAVHHSTVVLVKFIQFSLCDLGVAYILTGKLQTDNLEARFSQYRQLSGGNYNISVQQLIESEKKLRLRSLLGLHSSRYGQVKFNFDVLKNVCSSDNSSPTCSSTDSSENLQDFLDVELSDINEEPSLLYICGYASHKLSMRTDCGDCTELLTQPCTDDVYFNELNRGGLSIPSVAIIRVGVIAHAVMKHLISEEHEKLFLENKHQKNLFVSLAKHYVLQDTELKEFVDDVCHCGNSVKNLLLCILSTLSNIFLNNYSKHRTDKLSRKSKVPEKKRKLTTLCVKK